MNTATIWRTTLEQLENTPIDALTKTWLQQAHMEEITIAGADDLDESVQDLQFKLQVPNDLACDVITTRWRRLLEDILKEVTGQLVTLTVVNIQNKAPVVEHAGHSNGREQMGRTNSAMAQQQAQAAQHSYYDISPKPATQSEFAYASPDTLEECENEQRANMVAH